MKTNKIKANVLIEHVVDTINNVIGRYGESLPPEVVELLFTAVSCMTKALKILKKEEVCS